MLLSQPRAHSSNMFQREDSLKESYNSIKQTMKTNVRYDVHTNNFYILIYSCMSKIRNPKEGNPVVLVTKLKMPF